MHSQQLEPWTATRNALPCVEPRMPGATLGMDVFVGIFTSRSVPILAVGAGWADSSCQACWERGPAASLTAARTLVS